MTRMTVWAALACLCGACGMVGPDYTPPELATPAAWTAEADAGLLASEVAPGAWWSRWDDQALQSLVERSISANLDLRAALSRIAEARARYGIVTPGLYPTVDTDLGYGRSQASKEVDGGEFIPRASHRFNLGVSATWELDVWGRVRRQIEAAEADIDASVEDARGVLISIAAETARTYIALREAQERARITEENIEIQSQSLQLTTSRFEAGLVSELDVAQARSIVEQTRAALPPLEAEARAARNRLAVLVGEAPGTFEAELALRGPLPVPQAEAAVGVPADLLRRRPDLRRAERELAAQTARIGVAEGDLYPRLGLNGSFGAEANSFGSLFNHGARTFSVGPTFTWNIFDRERLHAAVSVEDERARQALLAYERTLLIALEEVENAMTGFVQDQLAARSLEVASKESRRAVELAREQYRQGLVSFQSVLDSQQRLIEVDDALVRVRASITIQLISLYLALGGGWEHNDIILAEQPAAES